MSRRGIYQDVIVEATGVTNPDDLLAIETSMRDDVFHSTLDWQTRGQLRAGAKKAWELVKILRAPTLTMKQTDAHHTATGHNKYLRLAKDEHVCKECL